MQLSLAKFAGKLRCSSLISYIASRNITKNLRTSDADVRQSATFVESAIIPQNV